MIWLAMSSSSSMRWRLIAMSESEIELRVEKMFDKLDAQYMTGAIDRNEYLLCCESVREMAERMYLDRAAGLYFHAHA